MGIALASGVRFALLGMFLLQQYTPPTVRLLHSNGGIFSARIGKWPCSHEATWQQSMMVRGHVIVIADVAIKPLITTSRVGIYVLKFNSIHQM